MRSGLGRWAVLAGLTLAAATPARAQDPLERFLGLPVTAVRLEVEERPETNPAMLALIEIKSGDRLTLETLRRTEERLSRAPRIENVLVFATETPGGVALLFRLIPTHPIDRMEFKGDTGLDADELDRLVKEQYGGLPTRARMGEIEETVRQILRGEGFRRAEVNAATVPFHDPDRSTLVITVTAGPRTLISQVEVVGSSPLSHEVILNRTGVRPAAVFRERDLAARLAEIRDELRAREYYAAIATRTTEFSNDEAQVALTLRVEAGPQVHLEVTPRGALPTGSVDDYIPIKREGAIDQDLLDDSRAVIRSALQREGYWRAKVEYSRNSPAPDELVIQFTIERGLRYRIERIDVPAGLQVPLSLVESQRYLRPGTWFSEARALAALTSIIQTTYRQNGFYLAEIKPEFAETAGRRPDEGGVIIRPNITEGPKAVIVAVTFDLGEAPVVKEAELRPILVSRAGAPYVPDQVRADLERLADYYASRGFEPTKVAIDPQISASSTDARLAVTVREGPQVLVSEIVVIGNAQVSRDVILDEITLKPGQPYSEAARVESRRRLYDLGSFRNVQITPETRLPGELQTRIIISVEESPAIAVGYGGGLEGGTQPRAAEGGGLEDRLEIAPRALFEIARRNLGGRNRSLSFFSRVSLKPRNAPGDPERDGRGIGFTEYRVSGTFRERRAFHSDTDVLIGVSSEQAIRTSFNFIRREANAQLLHQWTPRLSVSGRYALEFNRLFDENNIAEADQPLIDRRFPQVRLSILSSGLLWDRRNSVASPTHGTQLSASGELALRRIGSEVGYSKVFFQATWFQAVTSGQRVVLAARSQLGVARGFVRTVERVVDGQPIIEVVADLPASQRFFAGGSTSVRGYQLDRLGVPEILNPDGLSNGGNGLVVLNAELRTVVGRILNRNLALVSFIDGGNIFAKVRDLDLGRLRGASGFGVRYDSPLGPVRLDFGFKMSRLVFAGRRERGWEYHLSIGEAF